MKCILNLLFTKQSKKGIFNSHDTSFFLSLEEVKYIDLIYWCATNYPKFCGLKQQETCITSPSLCGSGIREQFRWSFWLGVSYKVAVKIMAVVAVIWSYSVVAHSHGWQIPAGNGKPQFLPMSASSRVAWVSSWHSSWLLPEQAIQDNKAEATASSMTLPQASLNYHFLLILLVTILTTSVSR